MNEQLIKFIELCLADGVISDKEREVIFRKAKALGVDEDECEILIDSYTQQVNKIPDNNKSVTLKPKRNFTHKKITVVKPAKLNREDELNKHTEDIKLLKHEHLEKVNPQKELLKKITEDVHFKKSKIHNRFTDLKSKVIELALVKFYKDYESNSVYRKFYFIPKEIVIKNSWLHGFKAINRKMNRKFDNLIFALSNSIFFFDTFFVIQDSSSGLSLQEKIAKIEFLKNNRIQEFFTYKYGDETRKIKLISEGYVAISYDELIGKKISAVKTKGKNFQNFTVVKFGKESFSLTENSPSYSISIPLNEIINKVFRPITDKIHALDNSNNISLNFVYTYRELLEFCKIYIKSNEADDINDLLDELELKIRNFSNEDNKLISLLNTTQRLENKLRLNKIAIHNEYELRTFPSQAIGSVALYNKLNENYSFFDEAQFNKIIRFVQHIEEKEKRYRDLYVNCTNDYINNPEGIPIKDLKKEQHELKISYQLLTVLANEINGDVVSFNKVYNKLEDAGMFMTVPEKQNQEYLKQISSKLDSVMNGLKAVFDSLQETNRNLREISQETSYIASVTTDMSSHLWDISWEMSNK
jgi:hypothetical protein